MPPKEKAKELINKYYYLLPMLNSNNEAIELCKKSALIAVDEILDTDIFSITQAYWEEVKEEIENYETR